MASKRTKATKPVPVTMRWGPVQNDDQHEKQAARIIAALGELEAALKEAHESRITTAQIGIMNDGPPLRFTYRIARITHRTLAYEVTLKKDADKIDPAFPKAA